MCLNFRSYLSTIIPSVQSHKLTYDGRKMMSTTLTSGDTLYIPAEWSVITLASQDSAYLEHKAVHERSLEELAVNVNCILLLLDK